MKTERHRTPWFQKDGYWACTAYYVDGTRTTIYQHREVLEHKLGRTIRDGYVAHHKDENRSNNNPDNLEEKFEPDHCRDHRPPAEIIEIICPECGQTKKKIARLVRHNQKQGKEGPFCDRRCAGRWNAKKQHARVA